MNGRGGEHVFISYASADRRAAFRICRFLEREGLPCWIAPRDIPAGALYPEAIMNAITNARALVLVLTSASNSSDDVYHEVERAEGNSVTILPFRLEPVEPSSRLMYFIGSIQRIDAFGGSSDQSLGHLAGGIQRERRPTSRPPPDSGGIRSIRSPRLTAVVAGLAVLAILAGCWYWHSLRKEARAQRWLNAVAPLEMEISLERPVDGAGVAGYVVDLVGHIRIKSRGSSSRTDVNLEVAKRNIEIVSMVRPLSETGLWFVQTKPAIRPDGRFHGSLNIGSRDGLGVGVRFQIVVLAVPRDSVSALYRDLPASGVCSNVVTVRRLAD